MNAIEINQLSKTFPGVVALNGVSFNVREKSVHGFLGPNGAGKSTTMKIIAGLLRASSGSVKVYGRDTVAERNEVKKLIGFLPENPPLYLDMRVHEFLQFVAGLHGMKKADAIQATKQTIEKVGLSKVASRLIGNLSKGYKQRVGVAQALVFDPQILILDEPTVGLDPGAIHDMRNLIADLKRDHTLVLSTHLLHEATLNCDDVTIINSGEVVTTGPLREVLHHHNMHKVIQATVLNWSDEIERGIKALNFVGDFDRERIGEEDHLRIYIKGGEDHRSEVASLLVGQRCQLTSLTEEELKLEDVFLKLTSSDLKTKGAASACH